MNTLQPIQDSGAPDESAGGLLIAYCSSLASVFDGWGSRVCSFNEQIVVGHSGLFWKWEASLKGPIKQVPGKAVPQEITALPAAVCAGPEPTAVIYSWAPGLTHRAGRRCRLLHKGAYQGALL